MRCKNIDDGNSSMVEGGIVEGGASPLGHPGGITTNLLCVKNTSFARPQKCFDTRNRDVGSTQQRQFE
jgi:hypothetical protein